MADGASDLDMRERFAVWRASGVGVRLSPAHLAQIEAQFRHVEGQPRHLRAQVTRLQRELDEASARQRRIVGGAVTMAIILLAGCAAAFAVGLGLGMVLGGL